jgi:cobalt-zinc-cadmium efflux system protein
MTDHGHNHGHNDGHGHGVTAESDRRYLTGALTLIAGFMAAEVVIGLAARSLALISDAAHMLTDAASIVLALVAMRLAAAPPKGGYTYGLKRAEILSAQANGLTLLLLGAWFGYEAIQRLIEPPHVQGLYVVVTGVAGIAVNLAATWLLSRANRTSLNIEGAYQHILTDLFAFIATTIAGLVVWLTGWARADAIAALTVAALMLKAGRDLACDTGRIFLQAAPEGTNPDQVGAETAALDHVVQVHDLHIWQITSGYATLSAHILVTPGADCHTVRAAAEHMLHTDHGITHTTLQVDHAPTGLFAADATETHCADPHGPVHHGTTSTRTAVPAPRPSRRQPAFSRCRCALLAP